MSNIKYLVSLASHDKLPHNVAGIESQPGKNCLLVAGEKAGGKALGKAFGK